MKIVILFKIFQAKFVLQMKLKINIFNIITKANESNVLINQITLAVNAKLIVEDVIQIKSGRKNCVNVITKIHYNDPKSNNTRYINI